MSFKKSPESLEIAACRHLWGAIFEERDDQATVTREGEVIFLFQFLEEGALAGVFT